MFDKNKNWTKIIFDEKNEELFARKKFLTKRSGVPCGFRCLFIQNIKAIQNVFGVEPTVILYLYRLNNTVVKSMIILS